MLTKRPATRGLADQRPVVGGHRVLPGLHDPVGGIALPHLAPERRRAGDRGGAGRVEQLEREARGRRGPRRSAPTARVVGSVKSSHAPRSAGRQWAPVSSSIVIGAPAGTWGTSGMTSLCRRTVSIGSRTPPHSATPPDSGPQAITTRSAAIGPERGAHALQPSARDLEALGAAPGDDRTRPTPRRDPS